MSMTMDLYNAASKSVKKTTLVVPGADHNNTFLIAGQEYIDKFRQFMSECLGEEVAQEP